MANTINLNNHVFDQFNCDMNEQQADNPELSDSNISTEHIRDNDNEIVIADEEHCLSQKLSQLSAFENDSKPLSTMKKRSPLRSPLQPTNTTKKMKTNNEELRDKMPQYLLTGNQAFKKMIQSMLNKTANSFNIEDLQEIAFLFHKIAINQLDKSLWTAYLRSGTGTFNINQSTTTRLDLCMWPNEVKSLMTDNHQTAAIDEKDINDDACLSFVYKILGQFVDNINECNSQMNEKRNRLNNFTSEMEDIIVQFVEQRGIILTRIRTETKIAIVEYDYKDRYIQLEYQQLKPTQYQLQLFENLTRAKQDQEQTKYEVAMLKQRFIHKHLPVSLNSLQILPMPSFEVIHDQHTRDRLVDDYKKIIQQTKSKMMALHITIAEAKMDECQMKFDKDFLQIRHDQQRTTLHQGLRQTMLDTLERRFKNIEERLEYLYNLKQRFFIQVPEVLTNM